MIESEVMTANAADVKEIAGSKGRAAAEEEASKLQAELQSRLDEQSGQLDSARLEVCMLPVLMPACMCIRHATAPFLRACHLSSLIDSEAD